MRKGFRYSFLFFLLAFCVRAQDKTIGAKSTATRETSGAHRVMIVPFEPRLYLSEIDQNIHRETKQSGAQIRHNFRDGLSEQLYRSLKNSGYGVLDLMQDTARYKKDIDGIYQYLSYHYQKVPDQNNYKAPAKEKDEQKIRKGQLAVETNDENRFMNAKITSPKLVPLLYGKHKTDLFIFINQLDIKAMGSKDPTDLSAGSDKRKIVVHYTVYSLDAKEINSGIAEEEFESSLNNPKKIIDKHFSVIAAMIVQRMNTGLGLNKR